jgi:alpha-amylase/alpha-mannosidase (GH57 family)
MDVSFVWHLHQPVYKDPADGEYVLPWVNLHATKNYHQMAELVRESAFPCAFNFVPCLLEQLDEYARGAASDPYQRALEKDPDNLTFRDILLLKKIAPLERDPGKIQERALKAMFSPLSIRPDAGRESLLSLQKEILRGLIPRYKRLKEDRIIEITASPYYHPLLPMIFDSHIAPDERPPARRFRRPEDGRAQIVRGREYVRGVFGDLPEGMWPSEGGVSRDVARAAADAGFRYALTDENVLWRSLAGYPGRSSLFRPYSAEGLSLFFRDRELSDLLGFEYQKWPEADAVADFLRRLGERSSAAPADSLCVIVLDGENPWESYPENGVPFLRRLFDGVLSLEGTRPVLPVDYLRNHPPAEEIDLKPGTWLGNFSKWVGSPAKNAAWDALADARDKCGPIEEIFVAEGSDWFWWGGEPDREDFDILFRSYLHRALRKSGAEEGT